MRSVYRKVSLERLSSPEQLDSLVQVTNIHSWLGLLAIIVLLAMAVSWAVLGVIPIQISSPALILEGDGILPITAVAEGKLSAWHVQPGDSVAEGQLIAELLPTAVDTAVALYSPNAGQLLEFKTDVGHAITFGQPVATLVTEATADQAQYAILYMPYDTVGSLAPNMAVTLTPRDSQYAPVQGTVQSIGRFPVSATSITDKLGSDVLAGLLASSTNAPVEVVVRLSDDLPQVGLLADAVIHVGSRRPIDLVIPLR